MSFHYFCVCKHAINKVIEGIASLESLLLLLKHWNEQCYKAVIDCLKVLMYYWIIVADETLGASTNDRIMKEKLQLLWIWLSDGDSPKDNKQYANLIVHINK